MRSSISVRLAVCALYICEGSLVSQCLLSPLQHLTELDKQATICRAGAHGLAELQSPVKIARPVRRVSLAEGGIDLGCCAGPELELDARCWLQAPSRRLYTLYRLPLREARHPQIGMSCLVQALPRRAAST